LTRILIILLNLGIFSKIHDRASVIRSRKSLKRFVSLSKFSFGLRGFPLSSLWWSANRRFNSPYLWTALCRFRIAPDWRL